VKTITSRSNTTIKFIRELQTRKGRKDSGKFFIEGVRLVGEAISNKFPLDAVIFSQELMITDFAHEIVEQAEIDSIELIEVSAEVFTSFSLKDGPHGIAAIGSQHFDSLEGKNLTGLWIALEEVQDPGNLGTIFRSLDGAGGNGIILIGNTVDPYHPTAVRSSMGAIFYLPIIPVPLDAFIQWKGKNTTQCFGTVCDAGTSYRDQIYPQDMVLIMGSEQKGMTNSLKAICDKLITIPMQGKIDSLNLSNAASIVLFEIYSRRKDD
jgi:TrmH family RNA methyltransferase